MLPPGNFEWSGRLLVVPLFRSLPPLPPSSTLIPDQPRYLSCLFDSSSLPASPPPLPSVSILSRRSRRDNETRKRRFANEKEEEKEKFSGRDYDRWCNATVNREWKWASRDFRRIKIIIRRKRVEWVKTGRLNGKESVGSRSAIRGTPLLPANRRENTWSSVPRNIYKGYI